ncbi:uncharacterized protein LOC126265268 isoform X2 [Aethina tumida]|nr:uncharacterized protein LOC126265268 isoform X2 [Aethina tumida]
MNGSNTPSSLVDEVLTLLGEGDRLIEGQPRHNQVIMFLGNTGSGKSSLAQFIAGDNSKLISKSVDELDFIIEDYGNKIGSGTTSKTLFPEILKTNGRIYYDCPGFGDTRNVAKEISIAYFNKQIIDRVKSVKLIFVVGYPSVRKGVDRQDFRRLVQHVCNFVSDINRFKNSIALIVTKVDNLYSKGKLASDEIIINGIAKFINEYQNELKVSLIEATPDEKIKIRKFIDFTNILLIKKGNAFSRIALFRRPDREGLVSKIQPMQQNKIKIIDLITNNVSYQYKIEADFLYSLSGDAQLHMQYIVKEVNNKLLQTIQIIGEKIIYVYSVYEKESIDIFINLNFYKTALSQLSDLKSTQNLDSFIFKLITFLKTNNLNINSLFLTDLFKWKSKLVFFQKFITTPNLDNPQWHNALKVLIDYLSNKVQNYLYFNGLYNKLSEYSIEYPNITCFPDPNYYSDTPRHVDEVTKKSLQPLSLSNPSISDLKLDMTNMQILCNLLDTLKPLEIINNEKSNCTVVRGHNIKLSEVKYDKSKPLCLYSMNVIYIDQDLKWPSGTVYLFSPQCKIIGNRTINLDGLDGNFGGTRQPQEFTSTPGAHGKPGRPGRTGQTGGLFFGFSQSSGGNLVISANGGKGENGENGQKGNPGYHGKPKVFRDSNEGNIQKGTLGQPGGNGGDGGAGGYSGLIGYIDMCPLQNNIVIKRKVTKGGDNGIGGKGGLGGSHGYEIMVTREDEITFLVARKPSPESSKNGTNGISGVNTIGLINPKPTPQVKISHLHNYKKYLLNNLNNPIYTKINDFLILIEQSNCWFKNYNISDLITDFYILDAQSYIIKKHLLLLPFMESLLNKTGNSLKNVKSNAHKELLQYLYASIYSKIWSTKNNLNRNLVIDVQKFLQIITRNINDMKTQRNKQIVEQYKKDFESELKTKIKQGEKLIELNIVSIVNKIAKKIDIHINSLLQEIVQLKKEAKAKSALLKKKEKELKENIKLKEIFGGLQVVTTTLGFFGPVGTVVGDMLSAGFGAASASIDTTIPSTELPKLPEGVQFSISNQASQTKEILRMVLEDALNLLKNEENHPVFKKIESVKNKVDTVDILDAESIRILHILKLEVDEINNVFELEDIYAININFTEKYARPIKTILSMVSVPLNVYQNVKNDEEKINYLSESVNGLGDYTKKLDEYQEGIINTLVPVMASIQSNVIEKVYKKNGGNQTHVDLDIQKWKIKSSLSDAKKYITDMTKGFHANEDLTNSVDKIQEGLSVMIDIYNRIQSYYEQNR